METGAGFQAEFTVNILLLWECALYIARNPASPKACGCSRSV